MSANPSRDRSFHGLVCRRARAALIMGLACLQSCAGEASEPDPTIPEPPAAEVLYLDGEAFELAAAELPTVLLFIGRVCPISNTLAPEMRRIHEEYGQRGVDFKLVYTDPDETHADLRMHLLEYELGMPAVLDFGQLLARQLGIRVTPEVALVLQGGELAYRGRINDLYADFGVQRKVPTSHDLRRALDAVLADKDPEPARTIAIGCVLPEMPK